MCSHDNETRGKKKIIIIKINPINRVEISGGKKKQKHMKKKNLILEKLRQSDQFGSVWIRARYISKPRNIWIGCSLCGLRLFRLGLV